MVNILNQSPSKISMLSLLISSKAHRESLIKVLGASHVTKDITVDQFDCVVSNIIAKCCLGFSDRELPSKGRAHSRVIHISMECANTILSRVLVDTGYYLNVIPNTTLLKLTSEGVAMKSSTLIVKAFDGS